MATFAALAVSTFVLTAAAFAAESTTGYLNYRVQKGDTLWFLSQRFGSSTGELQAVNSLNSDSLSVGQFLYLPVNLGSSTIQYRVQSGDSLYLVSQRVNRTVEAIKSASGLTSDLINTGQNLNLPLARLGATPYVVQPGDTLYLIAKSKQTTVDNLISFNSLPGTNLLVGQVLDIPQAAAEPPAPPAQPPTAPVPPAEPPVPPAPPTESPAQPFQLPASPDQPITAVINMSPNDPPVYRVASGDNLFLIAQKFNTTENAFFQTNNLHSDIIMPGQPLFIPPGTSPVKAEGPRGTQKPGFGELLDWSWARWIYNVGDVATVEDLQTRKTFQVRHLGGSNHADSEPLTKADTAIMKAIYGGVWSWTSRPVLLHAGGRTFAAAILGMPHSVETIADNDFPGHFDIYFLNSRTHNTNEIVPGYQDNILKAAGY